MKQRGYMCLTDFECDLGVGAGATLYPSAQAARAAPCCKTCGIAEVEWIILGEAGRRDVLGGHLLGTIALGMLQKASLTPTLHLPETGAHVFGSLESAWRRNLGPDRTILEVEIRFVRTAVQPRRGVFVYEDLDWQLKRIHAESKSVH